MIVYYIWDFHGISIDYFLVGGFKHDFYVPFHIWDNPSH